MRTFHKLKHFTNLIIILGLTFGLGMVARAADPDQDVTLTIHDFDWTMYTKEYEDAVPTDATGEVDASWAEGKEAYALQNVTFALLKVADLGKNDITPENAATNVNVQYTLKEEIREILFPGSDRTSFLAEELKEALSTKSAEIDAYALEGTADIFATCTTDANGACTVNISPDDYGLYIVVETKVPENVNTIMKPFLVTAPMAKADGSGWNYDIHVYPKNETSVPTVKKLVKNPDDEEFKDSTSVTFGDKIWYNLIGSIPEVTSPATEFTKFDFTDFLPTGIEADEMLRDPKKNLVVRIYKSYTSASQATSEEGDFEELEYGTDYEIAYVKVEDGQSQFQVILTKKGLEKLNAHADGSQFLSVSYAAKVGDADQISVGDEGNRSDVTLTYGRTAATSSDAGDANVGENAAEQEIQDAAIVLTYGFEMQKKFDVSAAAGAYDQVKFRVQNKTNQKYLQGALRASGEKGNYKITGTTIDQNEATLFSPGNDGALVIDGISADEYEIVETQTASGYVLLKEPILVKISAREFQTQPTTAIETGQEQQVSEVGISNVSGMEKATATVNGEPAEIDENGRVPRIRLSILNKKENIANKLGKYIPSTGDSTNVTLSLLGVFGSIVVIVLCFRKKKHHE